MRGSDAFGCGRAALSDDRARRDGRWKDARGVERRFAYNALDQLESVTIEDGPSPAGPRGVVATYTWDRVGNKLSETGVAGLRTDFAYDGLYHVKRRLLPESYQGQRLKEQTRYDKVGRLVEQADPNGRVSRRQYDTLDRLRGAQRDAGGVNQSMSVSYDDPEGSHVNKSSESDWRGLTTTYEYDALERETRRVVQVEDGYETRTDYDPSGLAFTTQNPLGIAMLHRLDGLGREVERVADPDGLGLHSTSAYDGLGHPRLTARAVRRRRRYADPPMSASSCSSTAWPASLSNGAW